MFILASELGTKIWAVFRYILWWIDSIGFAFIDNTYDLMVTIMAGFNSDAIADITKDIIQNSYILVGIFAFFRIAVMLVESIVNPDKLSDKNVGLSKVFVNFVIAIVMLIVVPMIFSFSRDIQHKLVVENQVIPNLILGTDLNTGKAGETMQLIAIKGLIRPDEKIADRKTSSNSSDQENFKGESYSPNDNCSSGSTCSNAVAAWNDNKVKTKTVSKFIDEYVKVGEEYVFVYEYIPFIPLAAGLFITYVLLSFTIDIGIRSVELVVLEIVSPFFIVTFIDPKMASSGPFKKWLNACIKSYLSLFIRIAIISVIFLFLSNFQDLVGSFNKDNNALANIILLLCILIFAKKAPKWIGEMFGLSDGAGVGGLGIGKKLAGAAAVGGLIGSGIEKAKGGIKTRANDMMDRKVAKHMARHEAKKQGLGFKDRQALARGVGQQVKADQIGKRNSMFKRYQDAAAIGGKYVNDGYKTGNEKRMDRLNDKADNTRSTLESSGLVLDAEAKIKAAKAKADLKAAKGMTKDGNVLMVKDSNGNIIGRKTFEINGPNGKKVTAFVNPQGTKEINDSLRFPTNMTSALTRHGENLVNNTDGIKINDSGQVVNSSTEEVIAQNTYQYACQNLSDEGRAAIKSVVADNVQKNISNLQVSVQGMNQATSNYSESLEKYNSAVSMMNKELNDTPAGKNAQIIIKNTEVAQQTRDKTITAMNQTQEKINNLLKGRDYKELNPNEKTAYEDLRDEFKQQEETLNNANSIIYENTKKHGDKYEAAKEFVSSVEQKYAVSQLKSSVEHSKQLMVSYENEINQLKEEMQKSVDILNDAGEKTGEFNPYEFEVDGKKVDPINNFSKINTILQVAQKDASKAEEHYEELKKLRENSGKKEDK